MKIAIPTRAGQVDEHFGHCESFSIFEIGAGNAVAGRESFAPPPQCGCKSNLVGTLKDMGVATLIAGNMGEGAAFKLRQAGIRVVRGASGPVEAALADFLEGRLTDKEILCAAHGEGDHECGHHHHAPAPGLKPL